MLVEALYVHVYVASNVTEMHRIKLHVKCLAWSLHLYCLLV